MGLAVARADRNRSPAERLRLLVPGERTLGDAGQRPDYALPGVEAVRRLALNGEMLGGIKLRLDRPDHPLGDLVLHRKDVG